MSTEPNRPESTPFTYPDSIYKTNESTVAMPEFIANAIRSLINAIGDYASLIAITTILFAIGALVELDYVLYNSNTDNLLVYSLILSGIFAVGIYFLMFGLSLATPQVSTTTALTLIVINTLILIVTSQIDDIFFTNSILTSFFMDISEASGRSYQVTNIWVVRVIQAGVIALIISEFNTLFYQYGELRLNGGQMAIIFVGLIIVGFGYTELAGEVFTSSIQDITDGRIRVAIAGAVRGAALAGLFLVVYKMAYTAKQSTITSTE